MVGFSRSFLLLLIAASCLASAAHGDDGLRSLVEKKVVVEENKTVFTLFCLLNLAGYDDENNPAGMHPVRLRVRRELARGVPQDLVTRIGEFYRLHEGASPYDYSVVAMSTSGVPDFRFTAEWRDVKDMAQFGSLEKLPPLLRELQATPAIEKIYAEVRPDYRKYIDAYRAAIAAQVSSAMTYCRVAALKQSAGGEVQHLVVVPNLLESFDRAFAFVLNDNLNSIEGPHEKIGYNPHEFIHGITNPISYDPQYESLQENTRPAFDLAKTIPGVGDLDSVQNYLDENLVRAIALKYLDSGTPERSRKLQEAMLREYRSGYILERFFYEQLAEYEKSGRALGAYYPVMLKRLDVESELARWKREAKAGSQ